MPGFSCDLAENLKQEWLDVRDSLECEEEKAEFPFLLKWLIPGFQEESV